MTKRVLLFLGCCLIGVGFANAQTPTFKWARQMAGTQDEFGICVADASGNIYTTGSFNGTTDFDPGAGTANLTSAGSADIFISKFDALGNFVWVKQIGGEFYDNGSSIALDASGNIYSTGFFDSIVDFDPDTGVSNLTSNGTFDFYILKLDPSGNFVWARSIGGASYDYAYSIKVNASGVYTTGSFKGTVDFDPGAGTANLTPIGDVDVFISKLDPSGNFVWAKKFGGTSTDIALDMALGASGEIYTTGVFDQMVDFDPGAATTNLSSDGSFDIFISKLDASGNFVWARNMGGKSIDNGQCITVDAFGNVFGSGYFTETADFDPGAAKFNLTSKGERDIYVMKLDASGNFAWAKQLGGTLMDYANSIAVDVAGKVFTTGGFNGTADFDPGAATVNLTSFGGTDVFISKLDAFGNFVWANNIGGITEDGGGHISTDASSNVYLSGWFEGALDADPTAGNFNMTSKGGYDILLLKLNSPTIGITGIANTGKVLIYPNPAKEKFNIIIPDNINRASIEVYNAMGTLVCKIENAETTNTIDLDNYADGLYIMKVFDENKLIATQKIIIAK